jgi:hypothetical protein
MAAPGSSNGGCIHEKMSPDCLKIYMMMPKIDWGGTDIL